MWILTRARARTPEGRPWARTRSANAGAPANAPLPARLTRCKSVSPPPMVCTVHFQSPGLLDPYCLAMLFERCTTYDSRQQLVTTWAYFGNAVQAHRRLGVAMSLDAKLSTCRDRGCACVLYVSVCMSFNCMFQLMCICMQLFLELVLPIRQLTRLKFAW